MRGFSYPHALVRTVDLADLSADRLAVSEDTLFVDRGDGPADLVVEASAGARIFFAGAVATDASGRTLRRTILLAGAGSEAVVGIVLAGSAGAVDYTLDVRHTASETVSRVRTVCLVRADATISLDAGIALEAGISRATWHLAEDHVFAGVGGKIRGLPRLDVRSSDVEASHALRIERIPEERLFSLRNRGMAESDARAMILKGLVRDAYAGCGLTPETLEALEDSVFSLLFA